VYNVLRYSKENCFGLKSKPSLAFSPTKKVKINWTMVKW